MSLHRLHHPAEFRVDNLRKGFAALRIACVDIGSIRTVLHVIEIYGPLRLLKKARDARNNAAAAASIDTETEAEGDEEVEEEPEPMNDAEWFEMLKNVAHRIEVVASYVINWVTGKLKYSIDDEVMATEVVPLLQLRVKWQQQRRSDIDAAIPLGVFTQKNLDRPTMDGAKMYVSTTFLKDAFAEVDDGSGVGKASRFAAMVRNGTKMFSHPAFAPLFTYQCPVAVEPQVDQLWKKYVAMKNRDKKAHDLLFVAVAKTTDPNVAMELIRIYERANGVNTKPPANWALSLVLMSQIRMMDVYYGRTDHRATIFHARKFANAQYLSENVGEYFVKDGMTDNKRYKTRKSASSTVGENFMALKIKENPAKYKVLLKFLSEALDKKDDWADALGIGIDVANKYIRNRPYTIKDVDAVERAIRIWNEVAVEFAAAGYTIEGVKGLHACGGKSTMYNGSTTTTTTKKRKTMTKNEVDTPVSGNKKPIKLPTPPSSSSSSSSANPKPAAKKRPGMITVRPKEAFFGKPVAAAAGVAGKQKKAAPVRRGRVIRESDDESYDSDVDSDDDDMVMFDLTKSVFDYNKGDGYGDEKATGASKRKRARGDDDDDDDDAVARMPKAKRARVDAMYGDGGGGYDDDDEPARSSKKRSFDNMADGIASMDREEQEFRESSGYAAAVDRARKRQKTQ